MVKKIVNCFRGCIHHTWIEIDLNSIKKNIISLKNLANRNKKKFLVMVKANAYGHGLEKIAILVEKLRPTHLGVSYIDEAIKLREAHVKASILLFTEPDAQCISQLYLNKIIPVVSSFYFLSKVSDWTVQNNAKLKIHIKINTGLNRFGFKEKNLDTVLEVLNANPLLQVEGVLTHYTCANNDLMQTQKEFDLFAKVVNKLKESDILPKYVHASNSAATGWFSESTTNLVRLGLAVYGLLPSTEKEYPVNLEKTFSWKTRIISLQNVKKEESIGYGRTKTVSKKSLIGIIGVGYSDGFRRSPHDFKVVLCAGKKVPLIGKVMMSHAMVDLTSIKTQVKAGDEVVIIGKQNKNEITTEDAASRLGTFNEEVITSISHSIPRLYK